MSELPKNDSSESVGMENCAMYWHDFEEEISNTDIEESKLKYTTTKTLLRTVVAILGKSELKPLPDYGDDDEFLDGHVPVLYTKAKEACLARESSMWWRLRLLDNWYAAVSLAGKLKRPRVLDDSRTTTSSAEIRKSVRNLTPHGYEELLLCIARLEQATTRPQSSKPAPDTPFVPGERFGDLMGERNNGIHLREKHGPGNFRGGDHVALDRPLHRPWPNPTPKTIWGSKVVGFRLAEPFAWPSTLVPGIKGSVQVPDLWTFTRKRAIWAASRTQAVLSTLTRRKSMFATLAVLASIPVADARSHISRTGVPASNTIAGSLALTISSFRDSIVADSAAYWAVYALWAFATGSVLFFTWSSVSPKHRNRYLLLVAIMVTVCIALIVSSSADNVGQMKDRLKTWTPLVTLLCAGFAPMVCKKNADDERENTNGAR